MPIGFPISMSLKASITHSMDASCGFRTEMAASSGYGTKRTNRTRRLMSVDGSRPEVAGRTPNRRD
jgi:hypothetical protein